MADLLIPDVPDAVLAGIDDHAARLGISRAEYIRRRLAADAATASARVCVHDLREFTDRFADLASEKVTDTAWR